MEAERKSKMPRTEVVKGLPVLLMGKTGNLRLAGIIALLEKILLILQHIF